MAIAAIALCSVAILLPQCHNANAEEEPAFAGGQKAVPEEVDFNFHVKPILSDRCFKCHGPDNRTREGGLRFDTRDGAFAALGEAGGRHAIIPDDPDNSTLIQRIYSDDPNFMMPPPESNLALEDYEKAILKKWIEQGATWKEHWSFLPPKKPALPKVSNESWVHNEIDRFVLARLEQQGMTPNGPAPREQLIRRLTFDLTGLPPTLEEIDAYLSDQSPDAYEKVIDRLLASDAYAEHMAAKWMDVARYADTHGYQDDLERVMWPWRDWVIHAFRQDMPFDEFIRWQLAGDLLPNPSREQLIATAFNRNHKITQEGGVIPEEYRVEYVADRTQTFSTAFLGLTMECARCHDHKYDPIKQEEYYQLFSFFNNVPENGLIEPYGAIPEPYIKLSRKEISQVLTFINNADTLDDIPLMVMQEMKTPRQAYILKRGQYDHPDKPVSPGTPKSLGALPAKLPPNRLGLAEWLLNPEHPLMARVTVNRFWQQLFGTGIVATPYDFGNQGALPSHPKLLDWLAVKLEEDGWDVKAMLKYIALSATYQQSCELRPGMMERDPENRLLSRAPRLRFTAEMIRDHALAISGLLNREVGGPSVKPYQPQGLWEETTGGGGGSTSTYVMDEGDKLYRRSMYTFWKRTVPPPSMMAFDAPTRDFCTVKRQETSTPLQALVLLNDPQIVEACRVLAYRAVEKGGANARERIAFMFRLATSRQPQESEIKALAGYFDDELARFKAEPEAASRFLSVGQYPQKELLPAPEMAAYAVLANTIFNLDEAITKG
ncbi:MAG: PSD1 domain-containing protein [Lewinellaceae bacterium]|nr:PSD1 domain-containing protein [Lewinellaceae bacterium]